MDPGPPQPVHARDTHARSSLHRVFAKLRPVRPRHESTVASLRKMRRYRFLTLQNEDEEIEKEFYCGLWTRKNEI